MNEQRMYDILLALHFSEKGSIIEQNSNTFSFKIARDANKSEVKKAIEHIFNVTVLNIQTLNVKGKFKRTEKGSSRHKHWKKAYIRLQAGQTLNTNRQE